MWRTLGQDRVIRLFQNSLDGDRLAHAYLLVGPPRVGKKGLSVEIAQALNCVGDGPPCGSCSSCRHIAAGTHPDVLVVGPVHDPKTGHPRTEIGIDQIREIETLACLPPFEGRYKVFILDGAERLSLEAANAFLKTLEEPLPSMVFLLTTSREGFLPSTLLSRCQRLEIRPLGLEEVEEVLVSGSGLERGRARLLAHISQGCLGLALDQGFLGFRAEALELVQHLLGAGLDERFRVVGGLASRWERDREGVLGLLRLWQGWLRDLLLTVAGLPEGVVNRDYEEVLERQVRSLGLAQLRQGIKDLAAIGEAMERNASPRLALEVLMLKLPREGECLRQ
jgi:DNA polymerase-3 subunit delta'